MPYYPPPAAGGAGVNSVTVSCDFGASFTTKTSTVVTGESWVTGASNIVCQILSPVGRSTDEMFLNDIIIEVSDIIPGDGFTLTLYAKNQAKGVYSIMCIGD